MLWRVTNIVIVFRTIVCESALYVANYCITWILCNQPNV